MLIILIAFIHLISTKQIQPKNVIIALECGSNQEYLSLQGFKYLPVKNHYQDAPFLQSINSKISDYSQNSKNIKYTYQPIVYMTERHSYQSMVYNIPLKDYVGKATLILKFAQVINSEQMYFNKGNERVFNVLIQDQIVIKDLDVFSKVGKFSALDQYIEITIQKDKIIHQNKVIGYNNDNLKVQFIKGKKDNPIVQGILLVKGGIENSDQNQYKNRVKNWSKNKLLDQLKKQEEELKMIAESQRKRIRLKIRNDLLSSLEQFPEQIIIQKRQKQGISIRQIMTGPVGIIIYSATFLLIYLFIRKLIHQALQNGSKPNPIIQTSKEEKKKKKIL